MSPASPVTPVLRSSPPRITTIARPAAAYAGDTLWALAAFLVACYAVGVGIGVLVEVIGRVVPGDQRC